MKRFYYGWIIVGVGLLVKMAALGFGRFAYAMLLSSMRTSLEYNYIQMGLLSGGILLGYLIFSFVGGALATKFGSKRVVVSSLVCSSFSMFFISQLFEFIPSSLLHLCDGRGCRRSPYLDDDPSHGMV